MNSDFLNMNLDDAADERVDRIGEWAVEVIETRDAAQQKRFWRKVSVLKIQGGCSQLHAQARALQVMDKCSGMAPAPVSPFPETARKDKEEDGRLL